MPQYNTQVKADTLEQLVYQLNNILVDLNHRILQIEGIVGTFTSRSEHNMGNNKITNLGTPTNDNDAATKAYVDSRI